VARWSPSASTALERAGSRARAGRKSQSPNTPNEASRSSRGISVSASSSSTSWLAKAPWCSSSVRARGPRSWTRALGSLDWQKRFRVRRAGERLWRARYRHDSTIERLRYDAASVTFDENGRAVVDYVKAAF
jgi:hypothetical protein